MHFNYVLDILEPERSRFRSYNFLRIRYSQKRLIVNTHTRVAIFFFFCEWNVQVYSIQSQGWNNLSSRDFNFSFKGKIWRKTSNFHFSSFYVQNLRDEEEWFDFYVFKKILISPIVFNSHNKVGIFREIVEKYIMQIYA